MDALDIPYLLERARAHRLLGRAAKCSEARSIHREFVRNYQRLLLAIRRRHPQPARPATLQATVSPARAGQQPRPTLVAERDNRPPVVRMAYLEMFA